MPFHPMLCESAPPTEETIKALQGTHTFERKYDGIRAILAVNDGVATLTNRNGVDISHRYPEIIAKAQGLGKGLRMVVDGEILAWDADDGDFSFKLAHTRDAQSDPVKIRILAETNPAVFMAFDMLYDVVDLRNQPYEVRRKHLTDVGTIGIWYVTPVYNNGLLIWEHARNFGWEGIVAKRNNAPYGRGRSSAWKKIKPTKTGSFILLGLEPGNGSRADTFGAAYIGVKTPDGFRMVGKVGSGFNQADLETVKALWEGVRLGLTPPPVLEVEYQEVTEKGALRFPVFKNVRTDVPLEDCTAERQLQVKEG